MTKETTQSGSKEGEKNRASGSAKKSATRARSGAESGTRFGLIPGIMEAEKRTVFLSSEGVASLARILKGAAAGTSESDALIAATLSAMNGPAPKLKTKALPVEKELTQPKPIWAYQEALATESGYTLAEVQEALLKGYLDSPKQR